MLRSISLVEIEEMIYQARKLSRKHIIMRLHEYHEPVQRTVHAMIPGTYITPHKHENPDKVELFCILKGRIAVLEFSGRGEIQNIVTLEDRGAVRIIDIPPRTYHTVIPLEPCAVLEIIQGPYDPENHLIPATWAPLEDTPKAPDYLMYLTSIVHNWR